MTAEEQKKVDEEASQAMIRDLIDLWEPGVTKEKCLAMEKEVLEAVSVMSQLTIPLIMSLPVDHPIRAHGIGLCLMLLTFVDEESKATGVEQHLLLQKYLEATGIIVNHLNYLNYLRNTQSSALAGVTILPIPPPAVVSKNSQSDAQIEDEVASILKEALARINPQAHK
jgi:hypothetical protein